MGIGDGYVVENLRRNNNKINYESKLLQDTL